MLSSILLARLTECLSFFSLASLIKKVSAFVLQKRLMVYVYTSIVVWTCTTLLLEGIEISAASITVSVQKRYEYLRRSLITVQPAAFIVVGAAPAAILVTLFAIMMHMIWSTKLRLHIKVSTTLWLLLIPWYVILKSFLSNQRLMAIAQRCGIHPRQSHSCTQPTSSRRFHL